MVPRCELRNSKCFGNLEEAPQTERKGTPKRSESARRTGLRILGLIQKIGMVNVHLVVLNILGMDSEDGEHPQSCRRNCVKRINLCLIRRSCNE